MAHGNAREGKWRGNWQMVWAANTLHTTSEYGVSSITTADAHTSTASNRLNWRPHRFKWTRPFGRKTKSGFCPCAITFQKQSTYTSVTSGNTLCTNSCIRVYFSVSVWVGVVEDVDLSYCLPPDRLIALWYRNFLATVPPTCLSTPSCEALICG